MDAGGKINTPITGLALVYSGSLISGFYLVIREISYFLMLLHRPRYLHFLFGEFAMKIFWLSLLRGMCASGMMAWHCCCFVIICTVSNLCSVGNSIRKKCCLTREQCIGSSQVQIGTFDFC